MKFASFGQCYLHVQYLLASLMLIYGFTTQFSSNPNTSQVGNVALAVGFLLIMLINLYDLICSIIGFGNQSSKVELLMDLESAIPTIRFVGALLSLGSMITNQVSFSNSFYFWNTNKSCIKMLILIYNNTSPNDTIYKFEHIMIL